MILTNKSYERRAPSRDAIIIIIYCEGNRREPDYFRYFHEISTQIKFEIVKANRSGNNSPMGLYEQAFEDLIKTENNLKTKYEINESDQVWFVIDTDAWGNKITELRANCRKHSNWFIAQSNPCFEVWLYYHLRSESPCFDGVNIAKKWKPFLNDEVFKADGGFDSRKHPILIKEAIENAKKNFQFNADGEIEICSTEVYLLAESFYPFVKEIIEEEYISLKRTSAIDVLE